jgi:hypothetical protein
MEEQDGVWCVSSADLDAVRALLGPGETVPAAQPGLRFVIEKGLLARGPPAGSQQPADTELDRDRSELLRSRLSRAREDLERAGIDLEPSEPADPSEMLGALSALTRGGITAAPDTRTARQVRGLDADVQVEAVEMATRSELLEQAQAKLADARDAAGFVGRR